MQHCRNGAAATGITDGCTGTAEGDCATATGGDGSNCVWFVQGWTAWCSQYFLLLTLLVPHDRVLNRNDTLYATLYPCRFQEKLIHHCEDLDCKWQKSDTPKSANLNTEMIGHTKLIPDPSSDAQGKLKIFIIMILHRRTKLQCSITKITVFEKLKCCLLTPSIQKIRNEHDFWKIHNF